MLVEPFMKRHMRKAGWDVDDDDVQAGISEVVKVLLRKQLLNTVNDVIRLPADSAIVLEHPGVANVRGWALDAVAAESSGSDFDSACERAGKGKGKGEGKGKSKAKAKAKAMAEATRDTAKRPHHVDSPLMTRPVPRSSKKRKTGTKL